MQNSWTKDLCRERALSLLRRTKTFWILFLFLANRPVLFFHLLLFFSIISIRRETVIIDVCRGYYRHTANTNWKSSGRGVLKPFWKVQSRLGVFDLATYSSHQLQTFLTFHVKTFWIQNEPRTIIHFMVWIFKMCIPQNIILNIQKHITNERKT